MQGDQITSDPDFFEAAQRADPKIVRPHLVVLERDGEPVAMVVARVERHELPVRAGYRTLYAPSVTTITVVYGGILGDVDEGTFRQLLGSLRGSLAGGEADVLIFRYLPVDSPFHRIASEEPPRLARGHVAHSEIHWELTLPGSLDDILRPLSASSRRNTRAYARKLESEYEGRLELRLFTEEAELDRFFQDVETISAKTYQRALGVSFGDTAAHRERTRVSMANDWFRGYVLYLDGQPVAFHQGELYRGRFRLGRPGYDPEFAQQRVGTYVLLKVFEDLCTLADARTLDYGVGDAEYKRRFGTRSWHEGNVLIFAPSFRATRINLTRRVLLRGVTLAKRAVGQGDLARSVKRRWRDRLSRG
jgi:CelD/BcsL family acetyltransferase involved in cellulose biosynthesis